MIEGVFFNYFNSEGLYLIFDVNKHTLIKKRDVTFYENILGHPSMASYSLAPRFNIVGAPVEEEDEISEVVDEGDIDRRIQKINELRPLTEDMLALTLAGLSTDQDDLAVGEGIAVMTMVSDRLLGYAREVLNEWKTRRIEEWTAWKALRVEIGKKRKDIDDGIMGLEGLHKSLAWEKEGLLNIGEDPGLEKTYTEIYQRL